MPTPRRSRKVLGGFTLVELLVVIAVIAILASLLLPALSGAKARAQRIQCLGNQKQILQGIISYEHDEGRLPPGVCLKPDFDPRVANATVNAWITWSDCIQPHVGQNWTNKLYLCPGYKGPTVQIRDPEIPLLDETAIGSYGYNSGYFPDQDYGVSRCVPAVADASPIRISDIRNPSGTIAIGDSWLDSTLGGLENRFLTNPRAFPIFGLGWFSRPDYYSKSWKGNPGSAIEAAQIKYMKIRHAGMFNIGMVDGHVEAVRWDRISNIDPDNMARWNRER